MKSLQHQQQLIAIECARHLPESKDRYGELANQVAQSLSENLEQNRRLNDLKLQIDALQQKYREKGSLIQQFEERHSDLQASIQETNHHLKHHSEQIASLSLTLKELPDDCENRLHLIQEAQSLKQLHSDQESQIQAIQNQFEELTIQFKSGSSTLLSNKALTNMNLKLSLLL